MKGPSEISSTIQLASGRRSEARANLEARRFAALVIGFFLGALVTLVLVVVASVYVGRASSWWNALHLGLHLIIFLPLLGGLAVGAGTAAVVDHLSCRNGFYKCVRCGHTLQPARTPCVCWPKKTEVSVPPTGLARWIWRELQPTRRHMRKRARAVLDAYILLIPAAYAFVLVSAHHAEHPPGPQILMCHVVLSGAVVVFGRIFVDVVKRFDRMRRFRLRATMFLTTFAVWPIVGAFGLAPLKALHLI